MSLIGLIGLMGLIGPKSPFKTITTMKKLLIILFGCLLCFSAAAQELTVGSYNLRNKNQHDSINGNGWNRRVESIANQIIWEHPDLFGTQEGLHEQLVDLDVRLKDYKWIGVARDDGKQEGEYSAIFYREDRVELLEQGNFWLNETPDRPALGWDAACIRICTWGHFRDRQTKREFYFLNLHMDHVGVRARAESAKLVMQRITQMTDSGKKLAILTGDFNVPQTDELYSIFTQSGILKDCYANAANRFAENGTYNGFDYHFYTTERIDHILVTPATTVDAFAVLTDGYWRKDMNGKMSRRTLSDHYPIFARIRF